MKHRNVTSGRKDGNTQGQLLIFRPEDFKQGVTNTPGKEIKNAPLTEVEKATVRCLQNLLLDRAQLYYVRMRKELKDPCVKELSRQAGILAELEIWPNGDNWTWPGERRHKALQIGINVVLQFLKKSEPDPEKTECMQWAGYARWVIARLGRLNELLRTGNLDEFFKRCRDERGVFAHEKNPEGGRRAGRTILRPHWPNRTHEFLAVEKEWKKENGQMKKEESRTIQEPVLQ